MAELDVTPEDYEKALTNCNASTRWPASKTIASSISATAVTATTKTAPGPSCENTSHKSQAVQRVHCKTDGDSVQAFLAVTAYSESAAVPCHSQTMRIGPCCSGSYIGSETTVIGEIENNGSTDVMNVVIDLLARNQNDAAIAQKSATIGSITAGASRVFEVEFWGTCPSATMECNATYVVRVDCTIAYDEGDPIQGSITVE